VGANVLGAEDEIPPILGTSAVKVLRLEVAATGLSHKQAEAEGFSPLSATITASTRAHAYPGAKKIHVHMVLNQPDGKILGGAIVGEEKAALRINIIATALQAEMNIREFSQLDLMYSPPFAPAWDPLLVLANQLVKKTG
jgi:NADPH-dependent 2,4-dienoyl-CoA reductase/sulfur reductase-like enzyme